MNEDNDSDIDLAGGINTVGSQLANAIDAFRNATNTVRTSVNGTPQATVSNSATNYTPIIIAGAALAGLYFFMRRKG